MKILVSMSLAALIASPLLAQSAPQPPTAVRAPAPAEPNAIPLRPGVTQAAGNPEIWTRMYGELWARNVTTATLTPFLPKKGKANGAAVLVIPGGGFKFVSLSNEGWPVAQWLAKNGIAAFVLKYRTDATPPDEADFMQEMAKVFSAPRSSDGPKVGNEVTIDRARDDAQIALRMIRANAAKWGVDPKRVGILGFSAGAMTTLATTLDNAPDARPDFIAPIYGFMTPVAPPPNPQPMFVALASNDSLFSKQGFGLVESWAKAGGSTELHWYQGGGHGFGSHKKGTTSDLWFDQFMAWMDAQGFLKTASK